MKKDPTEFRQRFQRWRDGEQVYKDGLPHYEDGKDARKLEYHPEEDYYYGGNLFGKGNELVVTGQNRKPSSTSSRTTPYNSNSYKIQTGDLLEAMTTGINVLAPSQWIGAIRDGDGAVDTFNKLMRGNSGFVTEDYAKDHPYISAGTNLVGDAVIGGIGTKTALETQRIVNNVKNRNLFAYTYLPPYGYMQPIEKAKEYVSHILKDRLIPDPDNLYTAYNQNLIPTAIKSDGGRFAGFRDVAWRKYLGLNENSPLYMDNGDGTFSYNLDYIQNTNKSSYSRYLNPEDKKMFTSTVIEDYVTGNGGNVASKIIYKPKGSYNRIEDIWDLHPFKSNKYVHPLQDSMWNKITNIADDLYSKNYYNGLKYKNKYPYYLLGGRLLNKIRYSDPPKWFQKSLQRFENMEMGPLLGGKPFTMRTDVPLFQPLKITK